jgi:hypothetical protein
MSRGRHPGRLSRPRRLLVYATVGGLWLSGALWLVAHYFLMQKGAFGPVPSPQETWWLDTHGAFAFLTLGLLGLLSGVHIPFGWRAAHHRLSGLLLAGALGVLVLTGWLLYYAGGSTTQAVVAKIHWILGLATLGLFLLHRLWRSTRHGDH